MAGRFLYVSQVGIWDLWRNLKKKKDQTQHMLINILTLLSNMSRVKVFLACSPDDNVLSGFLLKSRDDGLSHRSEVGALREKQEHIVCAFVRVVGSGDWSSKKLLVYWCEFGVLLEVRSDDMSFISAQDLSFQDSLARLTPNLHCNHTFWFLFWGSGVIPISLNGFHDGSCSYGLS